MINKIYDQVIKTIRENYKLILSFILIFIVLTIKFPYYIEAPGGIIDVDKRIDILEKKQSKGSFNLAYVKEIKATIPTLIYASINKNWDIVKIEEIKYENETVSDVDYRNKLLLEEANNNAILVAYKHADKRVSVENEHLYITYVDLAADTDLKIGDELLKINNISIINKDQLTEIVKEQDIDTNLTFTVKRGNNIVECFARLKYIDNDKKIGLILSRTSELKTDPIIDLKFKNSESGPSGGLVTALSIYNDLTDEDITGGKTIVGTGTIDENGNVGLIGGIEYKIKGAVKEKADIFLVPSGENYDEARKVIVNNKYDILLIPVSSFDDALEKLKNVTKNH